jgi:hypothetical protein
VLGEEQESQIYEEEESNMVINFSSEPTKYTYVGDRMTHVLFNWIENKKNQAGEIIFPDALLGLNHRGLETTLK